MSRWAAILWKRPYRGQSITKQLAKPAEPSTLDRPSALSPEEQRESESAASINPSFAPGTNILTRFRSLLDSYQLIAITIIALAVILRIVLTALNMPESNSDEGTMGLEAMHIAFQNQH